MNILHLHFMINASRSAIRPWGRPAELQPRPRRRSCGTGLSEVMSDRSDQKRSLDEKNWYWRVRRRLQGSGQIPAAVGRIQTWDSDAGWYETRYSIAHSTAAPCYLRARGATDRLTATAALTFKRLMFLVVVGTTLLPMVTRTDRER
jgi:hypothetical protein